MSDLLGYILKLHLQNSFLLLLQLVYITGFALILSTLEKLWKAFEILAAVSAYISVNIITML